MDYDISANGIDMGTYQGASERDAIEAYARSAGYDSLSDMARVLETPVEILLQEIGVRDAIEDALGVDSEYQGDAGWFDRAMAAERKIERVDAVTRRGPRFTDVHMESAADSVIEEVKRALSGEMP